MSLKGSVAEQLEEENQAENQVHPNDSH